MKSCHFVCCLVIRSSHFVSLQQMQYHNHGIVTPTTKQTKKCPHKINIYIALICWFLQYKHFYFIKLINIHVVFNFIFSPISRRHVSSHVDKLLVIKLCTRCTECVCWILCFCSLPIHWRIFFSYTGWKKEFNLNDTTSKLPLGRMKNCQNWREKTHSKKTKKNCL